MQTTKRPLSVATLSSLCLLITGCASIVTGTKQTIHITSSPDAADVKIERLTVHQNMVVFEGKTPAKASLPRKGSYLVTLSSVGYQKAEIPIESGGMNGWVWGNIGFGGLIGLAIDNLDGAAITLKPQEIKTNLVPARLSQPLEPDQSEVTLPPCPATAATNAISPAAVQGFP